MMGKLVDHRLDITRIHGGTVTTEVVIVTRGVDNVLPAGWNHGVTIVERVHVERVALNGCRVGGVVEDSLEDLREQEPVVRFHCLVIERSELLRRGLCEEHPGVADSQVPPLEVKAHLERRAQANAGRLTVLRCFLEIFLHWVSNILDGVRYVKRKKIYQGGTLPVPHSNGTRELGPHISQRDTINCLGDQVGHLVVTTSSTACLTELLDDVVSAEVVGDE